jgi:hypothetical protein
VLHIHWNTCVSEDVEKLQWPCTVIENLTWCSHCSKMQHFLIKLNIFLQNNTDSRYLSKIIEKYIYKNICGNFIHKIRDIPTFYQQDDLFKLVYSYIRDLIWNRKEQITDTWNNKAAELSYLKYSSYIIPFLWNSSSSKGKTS